jgi:hypothetical protein
LKPLAADGESLRKALIDEAVAEGVRLKGDKFNEEAQRKMMNALPVDAIVELRNTYRADADDKLSQSSGRKSQEAPNKTAKEETESTERSESATTAESAMLPEEMFV